MMDIFAAALAGCPRLGAKHMRALIEVFGTAEDVWKASDGEIVESHLLKGKTEASFLAYRKETDPEEIGEKLYRLQIRCVTWEDDLYPSLLQTTANPPAVLFYKGNDPAFEKTVAIVGSRKATPYGVQTAERVACGLSENGVTVISGGARGIDSAAHEGALRGESPTVVALACGLDHVYPPENKNLFQKIIDNGGTIISEYPPGTPPLGRQFPARNRIIAGMSRGILVVEAAERSGALITADFALEEGRDVFSVPGNIWLDSSRGTNHLIRSGAICCTSYEDILSEYGWNEKSISPCKESSPMNITDARASFGITPLAASTPMAIGRSRQEPSFFKSAGAKFTVTFSIGKKYPEFRIADWTRSFDSFTETAGSPTISKAGDARLISTSTVIT
jgi:DNA processing protein